MPSLVLGIDDAGRGPVIGPMILAGVLLEKKDEAELKKLGVKDSKQLSPRRREFLAQEIKKLAKDYHIVKVSASEIDSLMAKKINLNKIEAIKAAEIINELTKNFEKNLDYIEIIIDCPSVNIKAWQDYLLQHIKKEKIKIRCEHKADVKYVVVSAASILAKTTRDAELEKIKQQYKIECGSGYPSDPLCIKFLKTPEAKELAKKGLVRKSWQTWKEKKQKQKKLEDF